MLKNLLIRKMLKSQLKGVPEREQEKILAMLEKNPELFQKIAKEVQEKIQGGKDGRSAMMEVMRAHEDELKREWNNL
jgi:hypothetical protein